MRVIELPEHLDLSLDLLEDALLLYFLLVQDLHSHFVPCDLVESHYMTHE
jgi:hypothetical protein